MSTDSDDPNVPAPKVPVTDPSEGDKLKIQILLKEYDTLRQEIISRINSRFTLVGFGSGLAVFLASQKPDGWGWVLLASWLTALLLLWWRSAILVRRCSLRIETLEAQVNKLVGTELLAWEGQFGGLKWSGFSSLSSRNSNRTSPKAISRKDNDAV